MFISVIIFSIILSIAVFIGSYILSIIITNKNGAAILYKNYVELILGKNTLKIDYENIEDMSFSKLPKAIKVNPKLIVYRFKLKTTDNKILKFTSSYIEIWKNYGKEHEYREKNHSTLGELYEKIEIYMVDKMEGEYE